LYSWILEKIREILNTSNGWVGFSTTITNLAANLFMAREMKKLAPDLYIMLGGPEVTHRNASEIMNSFRFIDAAVPIPGYEALYQLVSNLHSGDKGTVTKGAWQRDAAGEIQFDGTQCWINMDDLGPANWQGINLNLYKPGFILVDQPDKLSQWYPVVPLHTSQGCSYNLCDFCYNVSLYPRYAAQSPQRVVAEIQHQVKHVGSRGFFFTDFEFNASHRRVKEICRLLGELPDPVRFYSWLRLDKLDVDLLSNIYSAGGRQIFIGVEAIDDHLLHLMDKGYNSQKALEQLQMLFDFWQSYPDFRYEFNLIMNYPGETLESVNTTLTYIAQYPHLFYKRVAAVVEFMLHEGTFAYQSLAHQAVGIMDPLLSSGAKVRSYRYVFPPIHGESAAKRLEVWTSIGDFCQSHN
jgi:tRNA A37 methylthiotransferase MiaB